jgi:hypothetical protein
VHHAELAPWEVVLELLLRLAEVGVALLVLHSVVSFVLAQTTLVARLTLWNGRHRAASR